MRLLHFYTNYTVHIVAIFEAKYVSNYCLDQYTHTYIMSKVLLFTYYTHVILRSRDTQAVIHR